VEGENLADRFVETFGAFRNKAALLIYKGTLQNSEAEVLECLDQFVQNVFDDSFAKARYETEHLNQVFEKSPDIKNTWQKGEQMAIDEFLTPSKGGESVTFSASDFETFLRQKIVLDQHVQPGTFVSLEAFLNNPSEKENILRELGVRIRKLKKEGPPDELKNAQVQFNCIQLCLTSLGLGEKIGIIDQLIAGVSGEFKKDLTALKDMLGKISDQQEFSGWKAVDSDDPQDLFLAGTEVAGSCQSVDGSPSLNKCLLGYAMDGKNRIVAIKDHTGRIRARSMLRLLLDQNGNPVLMQSRIYPTGVNPQVSQALNKMAIRRAHALGLPLVSNEVGQGPAFAGAIRSLGSPAPYEYVDAGGGVTDGAYTVEGLHYLAKRKNESS